MSAKTRENIEIAGLAIGALIGAGVGFNYAGLGGAILGLLVGAVVGIPAAYLLVWGGFLFLALAAVGGVIWLVVWIIASLWDVGKP